MKTSLLRQRYILIFILFCVNFSILAQDNNIDRRVSTILSEMTIEEKVGQMAQITLDAIGNGESVYSSKIPFEIDYSRLEKAVGQYHVGSILNTTNNYALSPKQWNGIIEQIQNETLKQSRLKIPIIYGIDAIHGATYSDGAVMFPQQITLAATFQPHHAYNMGSVTAYETRACGIPWNFSPVLDLGSDPRFSRQFEGFGEDPYLISVMGQELIKGYEGITDSIGDKRKVASCAKHFLGYSVPTSGKDRTPAYIPFDVLREYHLPPFKAAIEAGVESFMLNSGIVNNVSVHSSYDIITKLLKEELNFNGVVVSDWMDIINLYKRDKIAKDNREAIKIAINAGVDMSMVPYDFESFCVDLVSLVKSGEVSESRIDDAVRRILRLKLKLGLFETPVTYISDYPDFASSKSEKMAYNAAADAITLLKNSDNILPLNRSIKVLVTGPNANSMRAQNGGWSYSWQGEKADRFASKYNTFLEAIQEKIGLENVKYIPGVSYIESGKYYEEEENGLDKVVAAGKKSDVIIAFVGENSYTEKPGDLNDLTLSKLQSKLIERLKDTQKPIILVLNEGRPRCISHIDNLVSAVLMTYLPGNYGGDALADIIFGDVNPSGKLPFNYPAYPNSLVNYYHKHSEEQKSAQGSYNYESDYNPQYEFGDGLSYTKFEYKNLKVSKQTFLDNDTIDISVDVKNIGKRKGKETVLLFSSDLVASTPPDVKRLRRFKKIELLPNETKNITFQITARDLSFINKNNIEVTERGDFAIIIENLKKIITYK